MSKPNQSKLWQQQHSQAPKVSSPKDTSSHTDPHLQKIGTSGYPVIFSNNWFVNIACGLILMIIGWGITTVYQEYQLLPEVKKSVVKIDSLEKKIFELSKDVKELKGNYLERDQDGIEVIVGINSELSDNNVSVYKDNKIGLKTKTWLQLTNPLTQLKTSINMVVVLSMERKGTTSADLFISPKAAEIFGLDQTKGVFPMNVKILEAGQSKKSE